MSYLMSILMGLIQGVAEFLPISSSGHLALFQAFFGMEDVEANHMFFTVLLHFGTLISVCVVYWRDILDMIREFFLGIAALCGRRDTGVTPPPARRLVLLIIVATLPLFVMVFLNDAISTLFANPILVSCALLATGFVLYFSDRMAKGHKTAKNAMVKDLFGTFGFTKTEQFENGDSTWRMEIAGYENQNHVIQVNEKEHQQA